jgi:hypothetical protein
MFEVLIYFNGPRSQWSGKVVDDDVIARYPAPFLWLARARARSIVRQLNQSKCGYLIMGDGELIENRAPEVGNRP